MKKSLNNQKNIKYQQFSRNQDFRSKEHFHTEKSFHEKKLMMRYLWGKNELFIRKIFLLKHLAKKPKILKSFTPSQSKWKTAIYMKCILKR